MSDDMANWPSVQQRRAAEQVCDEIERRLKERTELLRTADLANIELAAQVQLLTIALEEEQAAVRELRVEADTFKQAAQFHARRSRELTEEKEALRRVAAGAADTREELLSRNRELTEALALAIDYLEGYAGEDRMRHLRTVLAAGETPE